MSPAPGGPVVVLVGPPGAGKTTVALGLAERLGVAMRDTDQDVEATAGKPVAEIFVDDGEPHFRALEAAAVRAALAEHDGVLALGGGAVLAEETRAALTGHAVVFLDVGLAEQSRRVGLGTSRPLLLGNVRATLKLLRDEREPYYRSVARWTVVTDGLTPEAVVDHVAALIHEEIA